MASGHVNRIYRPNTWLHRPSLRREDFSCQPGAVACGLYFCGEYEASIVAAKRLIRSYPDFPMIYRWYAAALGQLQRPAEAKEAFEKAVSRTPAAVDMYVRNRAPSVRPEDHAHLVERLRQAGWKG